MQDKTQNKPNSSPFDGENAPQNSGEEQLYPVTVDGETLELTLEQLIAAAEQGLSKMNGQARTENTAQSEPEGDAYQPFLSAYPNVKAEDIPQQVWDDANQNGDLLAAYRAWELMQLRQEVEDLKKNLQNRSMDVGSARSDGKSAVTDPIILALLGKG